MLRNALFWNIVETVISSSRIGPLCKLPNANFTVKEQMMVCSFINTFLLSKLMPALWILCDSLRVLKEIFAGLNISGCCVAQISHLQIRRYGETGFESRWITWIGFDWRALYCRCEFMVCVQVADNISEYCVPVFCGCSDFPVRCRTRPEMFKGCQICESRIVVLVIL